MDKILHHFEAMGIHCSFAFTGESNHSFGFLNGGALHGFRNHPQQEYDCLFFRPSCSRIPFVQDPIHDLIPVLELGRRNKSGYMYVRIGGRGVYQNGSRAAFGWYLK